MKNLSNFRVLFLLLVFVLLPAVASQAASADGTTIKGWISDDVARAAARAAASSLERIPNARRNASPRAQKWC